VPAKSVLDVEVRDEQFRDFMELFREYQGKLGAIPMDWARVGREGKKAHDATMSAILAQGEMMRRALEAQKGFAREARSSETAWMLIARHTKAAASSIATVFKFTGAATAVGGLLGVGGLFGLDKLGGSIASGRRFSAGLGIGYGQGQSFGLNFGRYVDPGTVLGNVATGVFDATSPEYVALLKAGISPALIARGNSAEIGAALLKRIPTLFGGVPANMRGTLANVYGYSQLGIGVEGINRYLNASPAEREAQQQAFARDSRDLNLSKSQQRAWQDFVTQLHRAGKEMENSLAVPLAKMLPEFNELSSALVDSVKTLAGSEGFKEIVGDIAAGIKEFAQYVSSPQFKTDVKSFAEDISALAHAVASGLKWLGIIPSNGKAKAAGSGGGEMLLGAGAGAVAGGLIGGPYGAAAGAVAGGTIGGFDAMNRDTEKYGYVIDPEMGFVPFPASPSAFRAYEGAAGLPPGTLWNLEGAESSHGRSMRSKAGALGWFGFMPATAASLGVNPLSRRSSAAGAARYLAALRRKFGGDMAKAVAAYNWGEGNVARDVAQYGPNWRSHVPTETEREIERVLGGGSIRSRVSRPRPVVEIRNNTGGSAVVTAATAAI